MTPPQTQLPRGSAITRHEYVIVRADRLRGVGAFIHIPGPGPSSGPDEFWLYTPPIHVALLRGHAPRVTLIETPAVRAYVHPAAGQRAAPLYYTDWYRCAEGGGVPAGHWGRWIVAPRDDVLAPGCNDPLEWHAAVAPLNQPVTYINYTSPSSSR